MTPGIPRVDLVEIGRPYEQPTARFGAEHTVPIEVHEEFVTAPTSSEQDSAPTEAMELSWETYNPEEVVQAIDASVAKDIDTYGVPALLDIEFAAGRAFAAYDLYVSDTSFPVEEAVAEYFATLTNKALEVETVTVAEVEKMIVEITRFVADADEHEARLTV